MKPQQAPVVPPFSRDKLVLGLERLREAFEAKQHHVTPTLLPPVSEADLKSRCAWFPAEIPEELVALYSWHEGQGKGPWEESFPFWFRDCGFSSLKTAQVEYASIMETYGAEPPDRELLMHSFPFAEFNGGWLVLPCNKTGYEGFRRPVISVHQGVDVWFYSVNSMVETCVEWVSHPAWRTEGLPEDVEMEIWRRHNPGIFGGGA